MAKRMYTKAVLKGVSTDDLKKLIELWDQLSDAGRDKMRLKYPNMDGGMIRVKEELKDRL